jgi:serine/threonine protein kinase/tetratricopeptide (TPR) repeat protein
MSSERWQKIDQLFHAALDREPGERAAFLLQACVDDDSLQKEVESLISSHEQSESFIERPAADVAADLLAGAEAQLTPGQSVGPYQIVSLLGEGGMGEVYLAEDLRLGRQVALKRLPSQFTLSAERVRRFEQEARSASALNHPNIVTIHEIGRIDSTHFITTEFIDGETLRLHLASTRMNLDEVLDIAAQIASALAAAHAAGITHRDIKPENVMIRSDRIVKVLDFGLAKLAPSPNTAVDLQGPTRSMVRTNPGMVMGTVQYMSPEQARGQSVDARTDIWSLGVMLYEMLTGRVPFAGETPSHVIVSILEKEPSPVARFSEVPAELERIVCKALRKDKTERYQTASDLALDLKNLKQDLDVQVRLKRSLEPDKSEGPPVKDLTTGPSVWRQTNPVNDLPESRRGWSLRRSSFAAIGVIAVVAALALSYTFFFRRRSINGGSINGRSINSIAVMPFANKSGDPKLEYVSDGLAGDLIESLSKVPGLEVKAFSTVVRYKGTNSNAQEIGQKENVEAVLFSHLIATGEDLTLQVELVDSGNGNNLWRRTYQKKESGLVVLQSELGRDLVHELSVPITDKTREKLAKSDTENADAKEFYYRGVFHARKITEQDIKEAIELFSQAIQKDPKYARAYAALASAHRSLTLCCDGHPSELLQAKLAAQKAVDLDDELAEGHSALAAVIYTYDFNWAEAEKEFKRALELDPNSSMAHFQYAEFLNRSGRRSESNEQGARARDLEPYLPFFNAFGAGRDPEKAVEQIKYAIDLDPNFYFSHTIAAGIYREKGMYAEAIKEARLAKKLSPDQTWSDANLSTTFVNAGRPKEARAILDQLLRRSKSRFVPPYHIAMVYNNLGDKERALYWLEKAYEIRDPKITSLKMFKMFWKNVENDPRFQDIKRRVGLP